MTENERPKPQGKYVLAKRNGNLIVTAGMTPRQDGTLIKRGKISCGESIQDYRQCVRLAAKNTLSAVKSRMTADESIEELLSVTVYINAETGFEKHAAVADFASEYYLEELGEAGVGCRTAIGVSSLPGNAPCEISIMALVR